MQFTDQDTIFTKNWAIFVVLELHSKSILNFYKLEYYHEVECIKSEGEEDNCSIQMSPFQRLEMPTTLKMLCQALLGSLEIRLVTLIFSKEMLLLTIIISITIFLQDKVKGFAALYQLCFKACITTCAICFFL